MYSVLLILHFLGLALGVGTGFAMMRLGMATRDMEPPARAAFMLRASAVGKNGSIGLLLLLLTGLSMLFLRGPAAVFQWGGWAFQVKLTLVVLFLGVFGYVQVLVKKAREAGGGPIMAKIPKVSSVGLLLAVGIVVFAVLAFK